MISWALSLVFRSSTLIEPLKNILRAEGLGASSLMTLGRILGITITITIDRSLKVGFLQDSG